MKIAKLILRNIALAICVVITYCVITPAMVVVTLLSKSFMLGFVVGVQTMLMKVLNKKTDLKNFRKHDEKHYIAQAFCVSYDIRKHYFAGDKFKDFDFNNMKYNLESGLVLKLVNEAGVQGFFFELIKEVFEVLGKDTTLYNGYDIQETHFVVYYNIKKGVYYDAMKNFRNWSYANDFERYIKLINE